MLHNGEKNDPMFQRSRTTRWRVKPIVRTWLSGEPWQPDPLIMDERYVAVHVRGKGLIVFSACSHAGVINVLLNARQVFPAIPLYGVLGGLHLSGAAMERLIPDTVAHLKPFECDQNLWKAG